MTNLKGLNNSEDFNNSSDKIELNLVNLYKNAISPYFNTVCFKLDRQGNRHPGYCYDTISNFKNTIDKELVDNMKLNSIGELKMFNKIIENLLIDVVRFFMAINNHDGISNEIGEHIITNYAYIEEDIRMLKEFDLKINKRLLNPDSSIANLMKLYCLNTIQESIYFLSNSMFLDIEKCPFKIDFDNLKNNLEYFNIKKDIKQDIKQNFKSNSKIIPKKIPEKWFALLFWIELKAYGKEPPKDIEGCFVKNEIIEIGKEKCHSSGQSFYKSFCQIDIDNKDLLKRSFGKDWIHTINNLSGNDIKINNYIKENFMD
jgi:hypothetical protein